MNDAQNRWLRRWSDENGELCAILSEGGRYYARYTVPAWEPQAGKRTLVHMSKAEAQAFDFDERGEYDFSENEQAHIEHDPFFNNVQ